MSIRMFSYVFEHGTGYAPNPEGEVCSLAVCKFSKGQRRNLVEMAEVEDWIVGTDG